MSAQHTLEQLRSGALAGTRRLNLACGLETFPREIFDLADTLEILDLSGNRLSALPDDLARLGKLRIVFCSDNQFTTLPAVLGSCTQLSMIGFKANRIAEVPPQALPPALRWLTLTDNLIDVLPEQLGQCRQLQKLMLAGNRLTQLPPQLAACTGLELLRISANRLQALPAWLLTLPRLAWLAYAGNPFCEPTGLAAPADMETGTVDWHRLQMHQVLGQGASGVIHRATLSEGESVRPLALKLFKGAVTSDGLPASEMAACLRAGRHPNLIPILGRLAGHPDGVDGLLMPLIDPVYGNLAGPPSLDSCTRDIYPPATVFALDAALHIAHGIASAACHLHGRGILHGDLYGHNILYDGAAHALLGDFGAASPFAADNAQAAALQRIEVRAFGCLLEELLERCAPTPGAQAVPGHLAQLTAACLDQEIGRRPLFDEIERRLASLRECDLP